MRTVGIICEYNPYHNGHRHQIDVLRGMGYDCIVCVMSGNYTQRGELAVFDKYTRAEAAVLGGADMVFELPFPYCSMSAEGFSAAGVHILGSLGIKDICFGSECADIDMLNRAADAMMSDEFIKAYTDIQKNSSHGSAKAFFEALGVACGEDISLLSNDILAISYICSVKRSGFDMKIVPIKRTGSAYNDTEIRPDIFPSASALRRLIGNNMENTEDVFMGLMPDSATVALSNAVRGGLAPVWRENTGNEILSFFKLLTLSEICHRAIYRSGGGESILQDGCGICSRLCGAAMSAYDFNTFIKSAYTAKYTDARINRVLLFSLLGVSDIFNRSLPEHTTLLAANTTGRALLSSLRRACEFPIITKPADAPEGRQTLISRAADELYTHAMPRDIKSDYFAKCKPYMHE